jgi:Alginate export
MDRLIASKQHRAVIGLLVCGVVLLVLSGQASAQTFQDQSVGSMMQARLLEEQLRPLIQPELSTPPESGRLHYDFGLIVRYIGVWYNDFGPEIVPTFIRGGEFQGFRTAHDFDFRPWLSASYDGVHYGFIRGQLDDLNYGDGDSFKHNNDWRGPFVDVGFYRLDVDAAMRKYFCCDATGWSADATVGRQFLFLGRGIVYALTADGVSLDWTCQKWNGLLFGSRSIGHFDNIDESIPGDSRSSREFFGGQIEYEGFDHVKPYFYAVVQRDLSDESPPLATQEFDYDSEYYGIGFLGEALCGSGADACGIRNLQYFGEFIIERGSSFGIDAVADQDPIRSWAFDVGTTYYCQNRCKTRVLAEFARASGDPDRRSPQNTLIGNVAGTSDHGYLGFGFLNTGISFAPQFSNLEFTRLGAAFRPFPETYQCNLSELELSTSLFLYWRPEENAGVSDIRADIPGDHYLGSEVDLYLNWRVSSDVVLQANYGVFSPNGDSFSVDRTRHFVSFGITWLF